MLIFPAIDLYGGKAVRLYKGDYAQMTVYSDDPVAVARDFAAAGAKQIHMVDLEGARDGDMPNLGVVRRIYEATGLFIELGGGIRDINALHRAFDAGVARAILGTAAISDPDFLAAAAKAHPGKIAAGADLKDGVVAVRGWLESSGVTAGDFFDSMDYLGIDTVICTDIARDGAMRGANAALYGEIMSAHPALRLIASGGVSSMDDVLRLRDLGLYGAIIGKAYYTGSIDLAEAVTAAAEKVSP